MTRETCPRQDVPRYIVEQFPIGDLPVSNTLHVRDLSSSRVLCCIFTCLFLITIPQEKPSNVNVVAVLFWSLPGKSATPRTWCKSTSQAPAERTGGRGGGALGSVKYWSRCFSAQELTLPLTETQDQDGRAWSTDLSVRLLEPRGGRLSAMFMPEPGGYHFSLEIVFVAVRLVGVSNAFLQKTGAYRVHEILSTRLREEGRESLFCLNKNKNKKRVGNKKR